MDIVELEGATASVWIKEPSVLGGLQACASRVGSGLSSSLAGKICWPCHSAKCPHPASQWASDRIWLPHTAGCCCTFDPSGILIARRLVWHTVNSRGFWMSTAPPLPWIFTFCYGAVMVITGAVDKAGPGRYRFNTEIQEYWSDLLCVYCLISSVSSNLLFCCSCVCDSLICLHALH